MFCVSYYSFYVFVFESAYQYLLTMIGVDNLVKKLQCYQQRTKSNGYCNTLPRVTLSPSSLLRNADIRNTAF